MLTAETRRMTVAEWAALDEDEPGELVDGALVEEEMPTGFHEAVAAFVLRVLAGWVVPRGGMAFGSDLKLVVREGRGRKADVSAYLPGVALPGGRSSATRRPPSIVVEVLSPQPRDVRRDMVEKLVEYAAFGVRYYWLIDPLARTVEIRELRADAPATIVLAALGGSHPVPGCDGLSVDLDSLWTELERLPEEE